MALELVEARPIPEDRKRFDFLLRLLRRPTHLSGLLGWVTTVDHKRIGVLYGVTALFFFFLGGMEALLIRTQLAFPNQNVVSADTFNQLFTMHGTTMVFLVVMPMSAAFFNVLVPLMIGARDVAFPRMNAFSYWMFLFGGLLLNASWLFSQAPDQGWFAYAPLTAKTFNPGQGVDFWILSLLILGISSTVAALNFIVTIINLRAPGMTMMRLPVFVWMTIVTSFLIILAFPVITVALIELAFDRFVGTNFFNISRGGLPILWQHLFWVFGHPEVYILILPAMGIVSEILPTFSRKPLFGYPVVVFSGAAIGFMGFTVWSHHMFTTGLGPIANSAFSLTTMAIAIPTGVKIFNWLGTLWGGQIRYKVPMMFGLGFILLFMIGGFSGIMHAAPPGDAQQQDTYFVVAHFHYVLIGGALFSLFGGLYYWFPKITGRMMSEKLGTMAFLTLFVGFNTTFFPMHWLGLNGMPRRIYTYGEGMGWDGWNLVCTVGAFIMLLAFVIIFYDLVTALMHGPRAGKDPWDGRTLEWAIPSPPPEYNFAIAPTVFSRDPVWAQKHPEFLAHDDVVDEEESPPSEADLPQPEEGEGAGYALRGGLDPHGIHMPAGSWHPVLSALGFLVAASGLIFSQAQPEGHHTGLVLAVLGLLFGVVNIYMWALEGVGGYHIHPDPEVE